jgi:hypothetical protein
MDPFTELEHGRWQVAAAPYHDRFGPLTSQTIGPLLDAVKEHGDPGVTLPPAPPFFRFADPDESARSLRAAGFARPRFVELAQTWRLPAPGALFEAMRESTARTGALLRLQPPERLARIRAAVDAAARKYTCARAASSSPCRR